MDPRPTWPSLEKVQARLEDWQRRFRRWAELGVAGRSVQGRPVYVVRLTDPAAPDEHKEHALLTAQHSGLERSGATGLLYLMEWLLSEDPLARDILRRQVVVCMPVVNPDAYVSGSHFNVNKLDPYTAWTLDGPKDPDKQPEAVAVQKVMDEYQAETHADFHGNDMSFDGYVHVENSGASYSNLALRPYHREICRRMDEAALAEGFPSDMGDDDAEQVYWGPDLEPMREKTWLGRPRVYAAIYGYHCYHTLPLASEVAWERSGFLRHRELLKIGNETWPGEYYAGYPVRVVMRNTFHMLTPYGRTAAARRRSRVELWQKQRQFAHGVINPHVEGMTLYVCATRAGAARTCLAENDIRKVLARLGERADMNLQPVREALARQPAGAGQWGASVNLWLESGAGKPEGDAPVENGLALRLRIPYPKARIKSLHMNGHPVAPSETDGSLTWVARGFTYVQVNVPPERSRTNDLFVVSCTYDPGEKRTQGAGW